MFYNLPWPLSLIVLVIFVLGGNLGWDSSIFTCFSSQESSCGLGSLGWELGQKLSWDEKCGSLLLSLWVDDAPELFPRALPLSCALELCPSSSPSQATAAQLFGCAVALHSSRLECRKGEVTPPAILTLLSMNFCSWQLCSFFVVVPKSPPVALFLPPHPCLGSPSCLGDPFLPALGGAAHLWKHSLPPFLEGSKAGHCGARGWGWAAENRAAYRGSSSFYQNSWFYLFYILDFLIHFLSRKHCNAQGI